jgi:hypothetical protein
MTAAPARRARTPLAALAGLLAILAALGQAPLGAHEIGTTRVALSVGKDRTFRIDIDTDAASLIEKLERTARGDGQPLEAAGLSERFPPLEAVFRQGVNLSIDGVRLEPAFDFVVDAPEDGAAAGVTIRLTGNLPPRAGTLNWSYSWTFTPYAFTVVGREPGEDSVEWLEAWQTSAPVAVDLPVAPGRRSGVVWRYLRLGFTHIVPHGVDHVLFVLGLFLLNVRLRPLLLQITAFTVSHSITLAASVYGAVSISPAIVEPLIAASIAYVAVENVMVTEVKRRRLALVFAFGLLHGLGFAGVLADLGLPQSEHATALVAFNLGVEAGQLTVITGAFLLVGWWGAAKDWYRQRMVIPASLGIAGIALYWTFERLAPG